MLGGCPPPRWAQPLEAGRVGRGGALTFHLPWLQVSTAFLTWEGLWWEGQG